MLPSILLLIIGFGYIDDAKLAWGRIAPTAEARDALLRQRSAAYEILSDVDPDEGLRVFQLGFEGEIYYFPVPVTGDWFGPGRYSEVARRLGDGAELADYLASMDTNALLINRRHPFFADLALDPDIDRYFTLVRRTDRAELLPLEGSALRPPRRSRSFRPGPLPAAGVRAVEAGVVASRRRLCIN